VIPSGRARCSPRPPDLIAAPCIRLNLALNAAPGRAALVLEVDAVLERLPAQVSGGCRRVRFGGGGDDVDCGCGTRLWSV
jgi:hypothetical protein